MTYFVESATETGAQVAYLNCKGGQKWTDDLAEASRFQTLELAEQLASDWQDFYTMKGINRLTNVYQMEVRVSERMCDFDFWEMTTRARGWLAHNNATPLGHAYGFVFYEHPLRGDEAPVLAVRNGSGPAGAVWNTQDFDLPLRDPKEPW